MLRDHHLGEAIDSSATHAPQPSTILHPIHNLPISNKLLHPPNSNPAQNISGCNQDPSTSPLSPQEKNKTKGKPGKGSTTHLLLLVSAKFS
jgi:hypothetical protein